MCETCVCASSLKKKTQNKQKKNEAEKENHKTNIEERKKWSNGQTGRTNERNGLGRIGKGDENPF